MEHSIPGRVDARPEVLSRGHAAFAGGLVATIGWQLPLFGLLLFFASSPSGEEVEWTVLDVFILALWAWPVVIAAGAVAAALGSPGSARRARARGLLTVGAGLVAMTLPLLSAV